MEDVDTSAIPTDRDSKSPDRATFSDLLNMLDGATSPHGLVFVMMTNHPEKLDEVLLLRASAHKKFTYANAGQIRGLSLRFGISEIEVGEFAESWAQENLAMVQVQERLIGMTGLGGINKKQIYKHHGQ